MTGGRTDPVNGKRKHFDQVTMPQTVKSDMPPPPRALNILSQGSVKRRKIKENENFEEEKDEAMSSHNMSIMKTKN